MFPEAIMFMIVGVTFLRTKNYSMAFLLGFLSGGFLFALYANSNVGARVLTDVMLLFTLWVLTFIYEYWRNKHKEAN
jgi:uncharacterized membrane protein YdjX (TVP38/TMEM64 family)